MNVLSTTESSLFTVLRTIVTHLSGAMHNRTLGSQEIRNSLLGDLTGWELVGMVILEGSGLLFFNPGTCKLRLLKTVTMGSLLFRFLFCVQPIALHFYIQVKLLNLKPEETHLAFLQFTFAYYHCVFLTVELIKGGKKFTVSQIELSSHVRLIAFLGQGFRTSKP